MILRTLILSLVLLISGCAKTVRPDLGRLYGFKHQSDEQPPVILIHGAFGSRLVDDAGVERWPGGLGRILWADYKDIALEFDRQSLVPTTDQLHVDGITDRISGRDFYGRIRQTLESIGGYQLQTAGKPPQTPGRHYYVFEYDWRQDNVDSAQKLHRYLDQIREDLKDDNLTFDIVAHSMGGLITRYFARYGSADVLNDNEFPVTGIGASYLRRVVLLGTPNLGSITSFTNMVEGMKVGFDRIPPEVLVTFPSAFQLLPHPLSDWVFSNAGQPMKQDLFDTSVWQNYRISVFSPKIIDNIKKQYENPSDGDDAINALHAYFNKHIERGRRFVWSLTVPAEQASTAYILFGGDCDLTPNRIIAEEIDGQPVIRLHPSKIVNVVPGVDYERLMLEPGDGTVTKASLLARTDTDPSVARHRYSYFRLKYPIFLCEHHSQLTGNVNFQDNLMHVLLSEDRI